MTIVLTIIIKEKREIIKYSKTKDEKFVKDYLCVKIYICGENKWCKDVEFKK